MPIQHIDLNPDRNWTFSTCVVASDFVYTSHTVGMSDDQGVRLVFARVRTELRDELQSSGIEGRIGADRIYLEVDDAVQAFSAERA